MGTTRARIAGDGWWKTTTRPTRLFLNAVGHASVNYVEDSHPNWERYLPFRGSALSLQFDGESSYPGHRRLCAFHFGLSARCSIVNPLNSPFEQRSAVAYIYTWIIYAGFSTTAR